MGRLPLSIIVSGSLDSIRRTLLAISATIKYRKHSGWLPFQPDETWLYESEQDDDVCPVCQGFEAQQHYSGDAILHNFPKEEQVDPLHLVLPRVHQAHPELLGECRCTLTWLDPMTVLVERLNREIAEAI